jgi:thymidylate synthase ThyX
MTITAKIICDSFGPNGVRLTTFVLKYPRFIHSEFMTHRCFSRNASSSRAIPFEKQVQMIEEDMAMPIEFRENKKGMQAGEVLSPGLQQAAVDNWKIAGKRAVEVAKDLARIGVHKQYVNRLLEPFSHISVVVTATEYSNFFALRHHSMAQPEIAELAKLMWEAYKANIPQKLKEGDWHLPFVPEQEVTDYSGPIEDLIKVSVARCARVSYNKHDGTNSTYEEDAALYDRLLGSQPIHASPAEHQAQAIDIIKWSGNFRGFLQYRKTLPNENITSFEGPLG